MEGAGWNSLPTSYPSSNAGGATQPSLAPREPQISRDCRLIRSPSSTLPSGVILSLSDEERRRISTKAFSLNSRLMIVHSNGLEKRKGGEPGLLASLLFPFRGIRLA